MKKCIAFALALVLTLSLGTTAFAATIESGDGSATGNVTVTVVGMATDVYHVVVDWGALNFTYKHNGWDEESYSYTGEWVSDQTEFIVKNNSNVQVAATASVEDLNTTDKLTFSIVGEATQTLAIGGQTSFTLQVAGTPEQGTGEYTNVAKVKLTIAKVS